MPARQSGFKVLLLGDLNINLDTPRDTREETIAEQLDFWNLGCLRTQFTQRYHKYITSGGLGTSGDKAGYIQQNQTTSYQNQGLDLEMLV